MVVALAGYAAAAAADRLLGSTSPGGRTATRIVAVAAASAVPMAFFVAWAMGVVRPGRTFSLVQLLGLFPYVALVQLLSVRLISPDDQMTVAASEEQPAAAPEYPPEFISKLPAALRRDILALEAEDHYVRVHTVHGSALILMRLADAAALIDPRLGLRVAGGWPKAVFARWKERPDEQLLGWLMTQQFQSAGHICRQRGQCCQKISSI